MRKDLGNGYEIDDDKSRLDMDVIWGWLSTEAYWSKTRPRALLERQVAKSWRCVAVYSIAPSSSSLVAFARIFSDEEFAYLCDVFVLREHRGKSLGKFLVDEAVNGAGGKKLEWVLLTGDAQTLYKQYGFSDASENQYTILQRMPLEEP